MRNDMRNNKKFVATLDEFRKEHIEEGMKYEIEGNCVLKRITKNGKIRKKDVERAVYASSLGESFKYFGSKGTQHSLVRVKDFVLCMQTKTFLNKWKLNCGMIKRGCFDEDYLTEYLTSRNIDFMREVCFNGFSLTQKEFNEEEMYLLTMLKNARIDFVIPRENKPTILLSLKNTFHSERKDKYWYEFSKELAYKLGFEFVEIDVLNNFSNLKDSEEEREEFKKCIRYLLGREEDDDCILNNDYLFEMCCKNIAYSYKNDSYVKTLGLESAITMLSGPILTKVLYLLTKEKELC